MWGFDSLRDVLDVVAVPIAIALVVPWITRRWQDRQRELDTKAEFVAEISKLVMEMIVTVDLFVSGEMPQADGDNSPETDSDQIYKKWRVDVCVIGSKLHAYFPEKLHEEWGAFSEGLIKYYDDAKDMGVKVHADQQKELKSGRKKLLEQKHRVLIAILGSRITGFRTVNKPVGTHG